MQIARDTHIKNQYKNKQGSSQDSTFDLTLFELKNKNTFELIITSKIVFDFEHDRQLLPNKAQEPGYQKLWMVQFKEIVEKKWGRFRLVDRKNSMFFVKVNVNCIIQNTKDYSSDYHIWIWMNNFSFAASPQPSFYKGYVWQERIDDIEANGNASHEFGHMIGVNHNDNMDGDPLMYGDDSKKYSENVNIIKNAVGYVYPEIDLDFHRDWVTTQLSEKKYILPDTKLCFEPSRLK